MWSHFEPGEIFSFKKKPWLGSHPTLGANEKCFGDTDKINGSKKSLEQKSNVWERARRRKSIDWGSSKKNFEEGYAKNGKERKYPSILREARQFSIEKRQQMPKVNTRKIDASYFLVCLG